MKLTDLAGPEEIQFCCLKGGKYFIHGGILYLKTRIPIGIDGMSYNALRLRDGFLTEFGGACTPMVPVEIVEVSYKPCKL